MTNDNTRYDLAQLTRMRVAVYGIAVMDGKVLMSDTKTISRVLCNFPGGAVDLGESPLAALLRECREEIKVEVRPIRLLHVTEGLHLNPDYPKDQTIGIYYLVELLGKIESYAGNGDDVAALSWQPLDNLPLERMLPIDKEIVPKIAALMAEQC